MDIVAGVIELKPNSMGIVEDWTKTINGRIEEAVATLEDEGVLIESWFHLCLDGKDYLLSYMRAESIQKSSEVFKNSEHDIDAIHQQFKNSAWGAHTSAKLLVDLCGTGT